MSPMMSTLLAILVMGPLCASGFFYPSHPESYGYGRRSSPYHRGRLEYGSHEGFGYYGEPYHGGYYGHPRGIHHESRPHYGSYGYHENRPKKEDKKEAKTEPKEDKPKIYEFKWEDLYKPWPKERKEVKPESTVKKVDKKETKKKKPEGKTEKKEEKKKPEYKHGRNYFGGRSISGEEYGYPSGRSYGIYPWRGNGGSGRQHGSQYNFRFPVWHGYRRWDHSADMKDAKEKEEKKEKKEKKESSKKDKPADPWKEYQENIAKYHKKLWESEKSREQEYRQKEKDRYEEWKKKGKKEPEKKKEKSKESKEEKEKKKKKEKGPEEKPREYDEWWRSFRQFHY